MREDLYVSFTVPAARSRTGTAGFGRVILTVPLSEIAFIAVNPAACYGHPVLSKSMGILPQKVPLGYGKETTFLGI